ncbi:MAG: AbrB/MazE/SpoVT family DNA-binding domain-containing protein [Candidatus Dormibacteraeota bacterium]|uniref:AbrB/MazE/SpoVT family DNA-binding domain-containing protein n=1 Tax=Candidatus Aeolococcus gillhamiae TaxID=3127015 RepID=A0A934K2B7_9BACT|nr:AbrB/MazE/SpoVT family DNA-binding domain-containing protein [Candidatus Dormibacteraeota bacterium]
MSRTKLLVDINEQGRMTLPIKAREALGIEGRSQVEIEVEGDELRVRPTVTVAREDAWAYTKEHVARVRAALDDVQAGRVVSLSRQELKELASS